MMDSGIEKGPDRIGGMIRDGAILTITFLLTSLIPLVGPILMILAPLPILYYVSRLGRPRGFIVLSISFLVSYVILGLAWHLTNPSFLIFAGFTGVLLSEILMRNFSIEKTFILSSCALCCLSVGFVIYQALGSGISPWRMVELYVNGVIQNNIDLYTKLNIPEDQVRMLRENIPQLASFFTEIFPALALSGIMLTIWTNLLAARRLFSKYGLNFPDFGDLALWKAPEMLVWVLIASGGMLFVPMNIVHTVGLNVMIVCCLIYLFQGLAIASFFFRQKRIPFMFRFLFYALILIQQYLLIIVIAFGLFDLWVDFRKRMVGIKDVPA